VSSTQVSHADRVVEAIEARGLDAMLVADHTNLRYLTGFGGTNGLAVVGPRMRRFVTDFRYMERVQAEMTGFDITQGPRELLAALADGWGEGPFRLGFEDDRVSFRRHGTLRELLPPSVELVAAGGLVEDVRSVKDAAEVEAIRAACALADEVYLALERDGLAGRTEIEIARFIATELRRLGASGESFPAIVASGPRGAQPHAEPQDVPVPTDTLVTIDMGCVLDGYCSDCTRTYAVGTPPPELLDAYAICLEAQLTSLDAVAPGRTGREVDAIARDHIAAAGHGEHFGHGLGHGVGMDIHEEPRLVVSNETPLVVGNVVSVEPGIYLPGVGGVRIEDLVVVTEGGRDVFTSRPKELMTLG
jgi:Xaa-Pro aminopeptidase